MFKISTFCFKVFSIKISMWYNCENGGVKLFAIEKGNVTYKPMCHKCFLELKKMQVIK